MGNNKPYPDYKDSNIIGLDKIPTKWSITKIKYLFSIGRGRVISQEELVDEGEFPVYSSQTANNGCLGYISTYDFDCEQLTWTTDGANAGTVFLRQGKHNCTNVCGTLQSKNGNLHLRYFLYCLQYVTQFYKRPDTNGAKIMNGEMAEIIVTDPSDVEKSAIANFLNHETAKIDTLIEKQQQLIQLLKEKRQAVISHAVTKGLNPNAPMKDSGVEWLGQVPEHWNVSRIKNIVSIPVTDGPHETPKFLDSGVPFVSAEAVSSGELDFNKIRGFISEEANAIYSKKYSPKKYDIYMVKSGATTGVSAIVETDNVFNIWSPLAVIRCGIDFEPYFVLNFMRSEPFQEAIKLNWSFGTQQNIGMGVIENLHVPCPPKPEAEEISRFLQNEEKKFSAVVSNAYDAIQLMQERRTALISAAVTGKIDVRNWQAPTN